MHKEQETFVLIQKCQKIVGIARDDCLLKLKGLKMREFPILSNDRLVAIVSMSSLVEKNVHT
jgi:hypothetical protein